MCIRDSTYSIYPRQFNNSDLRVQSDTCFVIMPFSDDLSNTYLVIDSVASTMNIKCTRADKVSTTSEPILSKICTQISQAYFIIVDIDVYKRQIRYHRGIISRFVHRELLSRKAHLFLRIISITPNRQNINIKITKYSIKNYIWNAKNYRSPPAPNRWTRTGYAERAKLWEEVEEKNLALFKNLRAPGYELRFRCDAQSVENFCAFSVETALQLEIICSVVS